MMTSLSRCIFGLQSRRKRHPGGYTLVELLICAGILPIVMGVAYGILYDLTGRAENENRRRDLHLEGAELEALLREDVRRTVALPPRWGELIQGPQCLILQVQEDSTERSWVAYWRSDTAHHQLVRRVRAQSVPVGKGDQRVLSSHIRSLTFSAQNATEGRPISVTWTLEFSTQIPQRVLKDKWNGFASSLLVTSGEGQP